MLNRATFESSDSFPEYAIIISIYVFETESFLNLCRMLSLALIIPKYSFKRWYP